MPAWRRARGFKASRSSSWPTCENSDTGQSITPSASIRARNRINRTTAGASSLVQSTDTGDAHSSRHAARSGAVSPSGGGGGVRGASEIGVAGAATALIARGRQQPVRHRRGFSHGGHS